MLRLRAGEVQVVTIEDHFRILFGRDRETRLSPLFAGRHSSARWYFRFGSRSTTCVSSAVGRFRVLVGWPQARPGTSLVGLSFSQNMPLALARGMFGAMSGAEFSRVPTSCKVSQCSTALPSAFIR
jgi:hypothetical protein